MKIKLIFAWYDLWIGLFWDKNKKWLYFFPIPMLGIIIKFRNEPAERTYTKDEMGSAFKAGRSYEQIQYDFEGRDPNPKVTARLKEIVLNEERFIASLN